MPTTEKSYKEAFIGDEMQTLNSKSIRNILKLALAELLGTAILVGLGCMSTKDTTGGAPNHLNVVLTFAFAIAISVTIFGHVSGSLINPALSLVALVMRKLSIQMFVVYSIAQCIGAILGYSIARTLFPLKYIGEADKAFCCTFPNPEIEVSQAFLAELVLTAIISMVLCSVWDNRQIDKHDSLPVKFGIAVIALAIPGAQFAGCSVNPARSFGPAFVTGNWDHHWIYWVAPMTGALFGSLLYKVVFFEDPVQYQAVPVKENQEDVKLNSIIDE